MCHFDNELMLMLVLSFGLLAGWCEVLLSQNFAQQNQCISVLPVVTLLLSSSVHHFGHLIIALPAIQLRCVWNAPCHYTKANYTHRTEMLSHNNWILRQFANGIVYIQNASVVQSQSHFLKVRSWCNRCDSATIFVHGNSSVYSICIAMHCTFVCAHKRATLNSTQ